MLIIFHKHKYMTYVCEIWNMSSTEYQRINVLWNNTLRRIFNCCWRESRSSLQCYCNCFPMNYITDQQPVLFYRRILRSCIYIVLLFALYCYSSCAAISFLPTLPTYITLIVHELRRVKNHQLGIL